MGVATPNPGSNRSALSSQGKQEVDPYSDKFQPCTGPRSVPDSGPNGYKILIPYQRREKTHMTIPKVSFRK